MANRPPASSVRTIGRGIAGILIDVRQHPDHRSRGCVFSAIDAVRQQDIGRGVIDRGHTGRREIGVAQGSGQAVEIDLHVAGADLPVAIDVDLQHVAVQDGFRLRFRCRQTRCRRNESGLASPATWSSTKVSLAALKLVTVSAAAGRGIGHAGEADIDRRRARGDEVLAEAAGDGGGAENIGDDDVVVAVAADHVLDVVDGDVAAAVRQRQRVGAAAEVDGGTVTPVLQGELVVRADPVDVLDVVESSANSCPRPDRAYCCPAAG